MDAQTERTLIETTLREAGYTDDDIRTTTAAVGQRADGTPVVMVLAPGRGFVPPDEAKPEPRPAPAPTADERTAAYIETRKRDRAPAPSFSAAKPLHEMSTDEYMAARRAARK